LLLSVKGKNKKMTLFLLEKGADPTLANNEQEDCISMCEKTGQLELISELVKYGATMRPLSANSAKFRLKKGF
jgi:ankyrin repeat protein